MIVEYVNIVEIVQDEREEYEHIYKAFEYNDINYLIFFTNYKHLFNINPDHLKIRIISILIYRIMDNEIIYE